MNFSIEIKYNCHNCGDEVPAKTMTDDGICFDCDAETGVCKHCKGRFECADLDAQDRCKSCAGWDRYEQLEQIGRDRARGLEP